MTREVQIIRDFSRNTPSELEALKKKLLLIINPIFSEGLLPNNGPVGSEIDEMRFAVYTLNTSLNKNSLISTGWAARAAFRAYQILLNFNFNFESKARILSLLGQTYDLLKSESMPKREEIKYEDAYDNILFHARKDQYYLDVYLPHGLAFYYKESNLSHIQKVTNRLCFYLKNFNFDASYLSAIYPVLSYSDNTNINANLCNIVKSLKTLIPFDHYVSLMILSQIAISDSGRSIPLEKMSCSYSQPRLTNLLVAISARLPAIEIIATLQNFCASVGSDAQSNYEALFAVNAEFEKYYTEFRLPRTPQKEKNSLQMELSLIASSLPTSTNDRLQKIGVEMNTALKDKFVLRALLLFQKISAELASQKNNFIKTHQGEEMFMKAFNSTKEKYFDDIDGVLCLKAGSDLRPEGITQDLQIEPIILGGNSDDLAALEKIMSQAFKESLLLAAVTAQKLNGSTSFYFPGIQAAFLQISSDITLNINLNSLSKEVVSAVFGLIISSLVEFKLRTEADTISQATIVHHARQLHESFNSLNETCPQTLPDSPVRKTAAAAERIIQKNQGIISESNQKSAKLGEIIAKLEAIKNFHDDVDLTQHSKLTSPRPKRTSTSENESAFFQLNTAQTSSTNASSGEFRHT